MRLFRPNRGELYGSICKIIKKKIAWSLVNINQHIKTEMQHPLTNQTYSKIKNPKIKGRHSQMAKLKNNNNNANATNDGDKYTVKVKHNISSNVNTKVYLMLH